MLKKISLTIPDTLSFEDLELKRDSVTGDLIFNWEPIEKICEINKININFFRNQHEDFVGGLLSKWYIEHIKAGGKLNSVAESLMAEIEAEDIFGVSKVTNSSGQLH